MRIGERWGCRWERRCCVCGGGFVHQDLRSSLSIKSCQQSLAAAAGDGASGAAQFYKTSKRSTHTKKEISKDKNRGFFRRQPNDDDENFLCVFLCAFHTIIFRQINQKKCIQLWFQEQKFSTIAYKKNWLYHHL